MAVGMGTVFSFLGLLVLVMYGSAQLLSGFEDPLPQPSGALPAAGGDDAEIALAIALADRVRRGEAVE